MLWNIKYLVEEVSLLNSPTFLGFRRNIEIPWLIWLIFKFPDSSRFFRLCSNPPRWNFIQIAYKAWNQLSKEALTLGFESWLLALYINPLPTEVNREFHTLKAIWIKILAIKISITMHVIKKYFDINLKNYVLCNSIFCLLRMEYLNDNDGIINILHNI